MTPTLRTSSTGLLGSPTGDLVLQICGGEHDGRVLRIAAAKCLIGSATGCTLRLRARGIRPVHCLILRGPAGAIVRCWSADALLNERGFSEQTLAPGDSLQLGPVKLSVMDLGCLPAESLATEEVSEPSIKQEEQSPKPKKPSLRTRNRRRQLFSQLREERKSQQQLQSTVQSQVEQLTSLQQQVERLQSAPVNVTAPFPTDDRLQQQLSKTIEQLRQELEAAGKRRVVEQQSAARQRANWEEQAEQRLNSQLQQLRSELEQSHVAALTKAKEELNTKHQRELDLLRDMGTRAEAVLKAECSALRDERESMTREIATLKLAIENKESSEELVRHSVTMQVEQLSQTFELVRQERDELFQRLQDDQAAFDERSLRLQNQVDEARQAAQTQVREAIASAEQKAAHIEQELLTQRTQTEGVSSSFQQEREGWTQARRTLEAEIAGLNARLRDSEESLHEARESSGKVQADVLADIESARKERDAVREQMLRQQQDWTEFRTRLEAASNEERQLIQDRCDELQRELATQREAHEKVATECQALHSQLEKLTIELEQAEEAKFAAENGVNSRLQQMTISMEQLQHDRGGAESHHDAERAEWEQERNALAQCVTELQQEVTRLSAERAAAEELIRKSTAESQERVVTSEQALLAAQQQLEQLQSNAQQSKTQCEELLEAAAKFQRQEQAWQVEREQLEIVQQSSTERLQQLEAAITDLQQQLSSAHAAVAVTCAPSSFALPSQPEENFGRTINVNNQELAALHEQGMFGAQRPAEGDVSSTINVNNQDLAALHEQLAAAVPGSLLAPREAPQVPDSAEMQARAAHLEEQAQELAEQQSQLEEEQANVARQRIELEQFQASLVEMERALLRRENELQQLPTTPAPTPAAPESYAHSHYEHSYNSSEIERDSNPLSESEAFAAMADQVAALYRDPPEPTDDVRSSRPLLVQEYSDDAAESLIIPASGNDADYLGSVSSELVIPSDVAEEAPSSLLSQQDDVSENPTQPGFLSNLPEKSISDSDFERKLDARMARVMRQEQSSWNTPDPAVDDSDVKAAAAELESPPTQVEAVNSVLDRLREAGLWKGEGTAKADQLPSSNPPVDDGHCRQSQESLFATDAPVSEPEPLPIELEETEEEADLSLLAKSSSADVGLLQTPTTEQAESDDSIESYMSRLMQRLRKSDDVEEQPRKASGNSHPRSQPAAIVPVTPVAPVKPADVTPLTSLSDLAPRSQAPEQGVNLAAMRELANSAARGAIATHKQQSSKQKVTKRTVFSLLALVVAAGFVFCWARTGSYYALAGVGLSMLWAISSSLAVGVQKMRLSRNTNEGDEEKTPGA
ncbi:hypothetical protein NA78x_004496 [Anatilimnocola sp. NA78]|uniref:FHA domain-containing protein n=1 Tax=Anatilimnocola sp. NA78 TaxID=3415683 RepID=UPI003CE587C4